MVRRAARLQLASGDGRRGAIGRDSGTGRERSAP